MTRYIAAYDTEKPVDCLDACKKIRTVHETFDFPGTFFIVGKRLEDEGTEYRAVLGDVPNFEIASHTYRTLFCATIPFAARRPTLRHANVNLSWARSGSSRPFSDPALGCDRAAASIMP